MIRFAGISKKFTLKKSFTGKPVKELNALTDVSFDAPIGQTTGIVGESGSGKSTLVRIFMGLYKPSAGYFAFNELMSPFFDKHSWRVLRRKASMVFQDPWGSLNPRLKISSILSEPLAIHGKSLGIPKSNWNHILLQTIDSVGLPATALDKYPHEFSGGQRQRIGIARSLILKPEAILLDEPVSALDVSIQAQILNLLADLRKEYNLTYLFIAHDLGVVRYLCDRIVVLYAGRVMETGDTETIFNNPKHPYTRTLLDAMPQITTDIRPNEQKYDSQLKTVPEIQASDTGCPFLPRCNRATGKCSSVFPAATSYSGGSYFCHNPL